MYFPETLSDTEERCIVDSVLRYKMAFLIGYFGPNKDGVARIGKDTRAIASGPMAQVFAFPQSRLQFIPSYMMVFGHYRNIHEVKTAPVWAEFHEHFRQCSRPSYELEDMMLPISQMPSWTKVDRGSPFVPNLGTIKQKPVDWKWWTPHVHQMVIWYGTSIPSASSQSRQHAYRVRDSKAKGRGKSAASHPQSRQTGQETKPTTTHGKGSGKTGKRSRNIAASRW